MSASSLALGLILLVGVFSSASGGEVAEPAPSEVVRGGGQAEAELERLVKERSGEVAWRADRCSIETPLPEGHAAPPPPGALEIETYPAVRCVVVTGETGTRVGDGAFWPLFHMQRRDTALTSPVEMDNQGLHPGDKGAAEGWSMAFLHRRVNQGAVGQDGIDEVSDTQPVTVLAAGIRGPCLGPGVAEGLRAIDAWVAAHPGWQVAADVRALHCNGPMTRDANKWGEACRSRFAGDLVSRGNTVSGDGRRSCG